MTRPQIIRADTIDLQNQNAPSAKDHTRQPARPVPLGDGPPAPHQAETLRNVEQGAALEMHTRSPRHSKDLSDKELQLLHEDVGSYGPDDGPGSNQELHNLQRNGDSAGMNGAEGDLGDVDGDDGMDDDLMDKISSSPSIDDGGYSLPLPRTSRDDSLLSTSTQEEEPPPLPPKHDDLSSSPFLSSPAHFPLVYQQKERDQPLSEDHHQEGGYAKDHGYQPPSGNSSDSETIDQDSPRTTRQRVSHFHEEIDDLQDSYDGDFDLNGFHHLLLPADDPLLDNSFDDAPLSLSSSDSSPSGSTSSWEDQPPDGNDDDTEDISFSDDSRFIDSGWGGECLREIEDIDFEFVYALHTFVATVEGQANATKGDTMVLLDDSNSYWWLVRVVKDSSIGYLPAEHIETPTERLARLNKHRNIDLSQTMLGDNPEKSKNPLKKAMRRRNAKTVQFAAPQYFDPSDVEYSTDEEEQEDGEYLTQEEGAEVQDQDQERDVGESATVEPLKARSDSKEPARELVIDPDSRDAAVDQSIVVEKPRTSGEILEQPDDGTPGKPGRRTVRNTDSFFKDDTVETRKINLTPSLLRDDSSGSTVKSNEVKELQTRGSLDSLEKTASSQEKAKEDKKRKEKKGMLNGLFKRKDKKSKGQDDEIEDGKKSSEELRRSPQPKESSESFSQDVQSPKANSQSQPQRQTSKLQKSPPVSRAVSANRSNSSNRSQATKPLAPRDEPTAVNSIITDQQKTVVLEANNAPQPTSQPNGLVRAVQPEQRQWSDDTPSPLRVQHVEQLAEQHVQPEAPKDTSNGMFSSTIDAPRPSPSSSEPRAEHVRIAKQRMPMDDSDSSSDTEEKLALLTTHERPGQAKSLTDAPKERLSESPVQVPSQNPVSTKNPPPLMIDTSSQEDPSTSPVSPLSSPELIEAPQEGKAREATPASTTQSSSSTPTWSDASLRAYLEDDTDIRDLLVVVHDKSDVKPAAAADHPMVKNLFKEENRKLGEISNQLDGLLGNFLARRSRLPISKQS